jgi:hypothetical protein
LSDKRHGLPSWCPDWRLPRSLEPSSNALKEMYQAGGESSKGVSFSGYGKSLALSVQGFLLDTIQATEPALLPGSEKIPDFTTRAMNLASSSSVGLLYFNGENIQTSVSRTLSLDLLRRGYGDRITNTIWHVFKSTYKPPSSYRPDAPQHQRLEMFRRDVLSTMLRVNLGRRFVVTQKIGYMGLVPAAARIGDEIFILFGGSVPFILRREAYHYKLVGSC